MNSNDQDTTMNISGVLVKAYPEHLLSIEKALSRMNGVEVHGNNEDGRMVITVEDNSANNISDTLVQIQGVPGVLSAAMIYHQFEE
jgi:nitrate reductase NapD